VDLSHQLDPVDHQRLSLLVDLEQLSQHLENPLNL
jgi:hypothetical protein